MHIASSDKAFAAIESIASGHERHCRAVREIAESEFASDRVLTELVDSLST